MLSALRSITYCFAAFDDAKEEPKNQEAILHFFSALFSSERGESEPCHIKSSRTTLGASHMAKKTSMKRNTYV